MHIHTSRVARLVVLWVEIGPEIEAQKINAKRLPLNNAIPLGTKRHFFESQSGSTAGSGLLRGTRPMFFQLQRMTKVTLGSSIGDRAAAPGIISRPNGTQTTLKSICVRAPEPTTRNA